MKDVALFKGWRLSAPADRLGILRAVTGIGALISLTDIREQFARSICCDPCLYHPIGLSQVLFHQPLSPPTAELMFWSTVVCAFFFTAGFLHRVSGPVFSLLFLATISYHFSWGYLWHENHLLALMALVLGFSGSADGFSVDAQINKRQGHRKPVDSPRYWFPICLIWSITAAVYFLAGAAKVLGPAGFDWANGENLRMLVAARALRDEVQECVLMWPSRMLACNPFLLSCIASGALVVELAAPLFFFNGLTRRLWAICAWGMHVGIALTMGISFTIQLLFISFLPCFDVERIPSVLKSLLGKTKKMSEATALPKTAPQKVASLR